MNSRILAFFITNSKKSDNNYFYARNYLIELCCEFDLEYFEKISNRYIVHLCYTGDINNLIIANKSYLSFCVGPYIGQIDSGFDSSITNREFIRDRFLRVKIINNEVIIENDHVGSIPLFYSLRDHISLSNIESVVVLDSNCDYEDISPSNMYGYLRYGHYIWDETLFYHIFLQEPDSEFIFNLDDNSVSKKNLYTIKCSESRKYHSDLEIASELKNLNLELVNSSLSNAEEIILPLSAGYDSRMLLVALSENEKLKRNLICFTYGPKGSIEVESAKRLCKLYDVDWHHIDLPCQYLKKKYLYKIGLIFGSSLHFHGMYQLEFWEQIRRFVKTDNPILISGFMTGVPVGQHISKLHIYSSKCILTEAMNEFSQSKVFTDTELLDMSKKFDESHIRAAEKKYKKAFDSFEGEIYQKSVIFDVWTRQRNFIGYYPRTLEWETICLSPHMTPLYQNFFFSISEKHITDRLAVELMFKYFYPEAAKIPSNSNGIKSLTSKVENFLLYVGKKMKKYRLGRILPYRYRDTPINFDIEAIKNCKKEGVWPIFSLIGNSKEHFIQFFPDDYVKKQYDYAIKGSIKAYNKLRYIQSIAFTYNLIESKYMKNSDRDKKGTR